MLVLEVQGLEKHMNFGSPYPYGIAPATTIIFGLQSLGDDVATAGSSRARAATTFREEEPGVA